MTAPFRLVAEYDLRLRVGDRKGPYLVREVRRIEADYGSAIAFVLEAAGGELGYFEAVSGAMMSQVLRAMPRVGDSVEFHREANAVGFDRCGRRFEHRQEGVKVLRRGGG